MMKKLISAQVIKQAHKDGVSEIHAPVSTTIVTAEARSEAEKLGVKIMDSLQPSAKKREEQSPDEQTIELIMGKVREKLPGNKYSDEQIKNAVIEILSKI